MVKKRWFKKREEILKGTPYDSLFEKKLHERFFKDARFHDKSDHVDYIVEHYYEPDFVLDKDGRTIYIEAKGRFRDSTEARKYICIRDSLKEGEELIFIWEKAGTVFPFSKRRKDGTRATHKEWADKNGFRNWTQDEFNLDKL